MNTKAKFTEEELQDIWSALSFFVSTYPNKGSSQTKAAMMKIIKKIRGVK